MNVDPVKICWARTARSPALQTALQLTEEPDVASKMKIRGQQIALKKESILIFRAGSEGGPIQQLESLPDFSTELTIGAAPPLWDALSERVRAALPRHG